MPGLWKKIVLVLALLVTGLTAQAQTPSADVADCRGEITDPDVQLQMDLCSAHLGCKLVLKINKTCTAVRGFLDRLGQKIEKTSNSLMGSLFGRKEIPADAIWEASQTDNTRSIGSNADVQAREKAIRDGLATSTGSWRTGRNAAGTEYAAFGSTSKDGNAAEGWGMAVFSNGEISRGQYADGKLNGQGERVVLGSDGGSSRHSGEYSSGQATGKGMRVAATGSTSEGEFMGGALYQGTRRAPDGSSEKGSFDLKTQQLTWGEKLGPDGALLEKGSFRDGRLYTGDRYAAGQLKEHVDGAAVERAAAEARQRAVLESEAKARVAAEGKERDYRASLGTMNAGQLYALADELKSNGDANKSREVLRALVSRFPDHPLGAQAVQQMQALSQPRPVPAAAAPPAARTDFSSVCMRNYRKIWDTLKAQQAPIYPGIDSTLRDNAPLVDQVLAPCAGFDRSAADMRKRVQDNTRDEIETCRRNGTMPMCASRTDPQNQRGADLLRAQVAMALSNPNYSADLGSAGNGSTGAAASAGAAIPPTSPGVRAFIGASTGNVCVGEPLNNASYDAAMARLPQNSATVTIRGAIVGIDLQLEAYRRCEASSVSAQVNDLLRSRESALKACRQIAATDDCLVSPF